MSDELRLRRETEAQLGALAEVDDIDTSDRLANVLLVEDSNFDVQAVSRGLGSSVRLVTVSDPAAALDAAGRVDLDIDLAIVSLDLKNDGGLRVASGLRAHDRTRRAPILALAEPEERELVAKSLELGVTDYLLKPIDQNELAARARTQIKRKWFQDRLHASYHRTVAMAATDELTGLFNRRYMLSHLENVLRRSAGTGRPVSVMMIDLDNFKIVNDTYGHPVGDKVLAEVARRIGQSVRGVDLAARYGGEEFIVVMPDTDRAGANVVAERLRQAVAGGPIDVGGTKLNLTVSVGLAVDGPTIGAEALIKRADEALYAAKKSGRNRVAEFA
jgi:two-component system cell cycle response regulator